MHPRHTPSFLSEINPSLADQMFTQKDLTLQTGFCGMEECDIIAKVKKNYVLF